MWIWLAIVATTMVLLYTIRGILPPFLIGIAIAYFLDPVADELERLGCSRTLATGIITITFFATVIALIVLIYPLVQEQLVAFFHKIPALVQAVEKLAAPYTDDLRRMFPAAQINGLQDASQSFIGTGASWLGKVVQSLWAGGLAIVNIVSIVLITPVVAFYMLRDWDVMTAKIDRWLPREFAPTIRQLMAEIDTIISGFVRGIGTVVLFLATVYGTGLTLVGLEFGLVVGLLAGFLSFIPYVGAIVGVTTAVIIALVQFGDFFHIALVLLVFAIGQTCEGFYLTPRLVGEKVGLHPVWVIFALLTGGFLLGFAGVMLAIPIAATVGVLVRFFQGQYIASPLYHGNRHKRDMALPSAPDDPL
jgi:predicted PurR-regulated permease PerM